MTIDHLLTRLLAPEPDPGRAADLAHLAFIEWLSLLPGDADFRRLAMSAFAEARPFRDTAPAAAVFCDLLIAATMHPPRPLDLRLPAPERRGGQRARRALY